MRAHVRALSRKHDEQLTGGPGGLWCAQCFYHTILECRCRGRIFRSNACARHLLARASVRWAALVCCSRHLHEHGSIVVRSHTQAGGRRETPRWFHAAAAPATDARRLVETPIATLVVRVSSERVSRAHGSSGLRAANLCDPGSGSHGCLPGP